MTKRFTEKLIACCAILACSSGIISRANAQTKRRLQNDYY